MKESWEKECKKPKECGNENKLWGKKSRVMDEKKATDLSNLRHWPGVQQTTAANARSVSLLTSGPITSAHRGHTPG
ncbi:hypothetical protein F2P81_017382 [Scophthalmus maximus]|uniref:Uncharacterized protein n=1 Tax=Scophthalmus maximus TaxID=52904 RepID=A0A6A4SHL6_SCOMX|nr:hypothetical protein F2P81_017382 [Scophthalmus maximus]